MTEISESKCSAAGKSCSMGPNGPDQEIQCEFCGAPAFSLDTIKHPHVDAASKALGISPEVVAAVAASESAQAQVVPAVDASESAPVAAKITPKRVRRLEREAKSLSKEVQEAMDAAAAQAKKARANFKQYRKKLDGNSYEYGRLGISIGKPRVVEPISCLSSYTDCIEGSANACRETQFMHVPLLCAFYTSRKPGRRALYLKVGRSTAVMIGNESDDLPDDSVRKCQFGRDLKVFVVPHTQITVTN